MRLRRGCDPSRNAEVVRAKGDSRKTLAEFKPTKSTVGDCCVPSACLGAEMAQMSLADLIVNIFLVLEILVVDDLV